MAINLWKLGGKPTSYNPLPVGFGNSVSLPIQKDYIVTFKAKSLSSAMLRVSSFSVVNDIMVDQVLTPNFKNYYFTWKETEGGLFVLHDLNSIGDIIIEGIELVQKPLPKLTINGIDGFQSGKWTLHANASVVDDETLILNQTANAQDSYCWIPCLPNTPYVFSFEGERPYFTTHVAKDGAVSQDFAFTTSPRIFTTSSNATFIRVAFAGLFGATGQFTFKRPMLNLGTIPAPFRKKTGEKMVMPVLKKNLFSVVTFFANQAFANMVENVGNYGYKILNQSFDPNFMYDLKPNTNYTVSWKKDNQAQIRLEVSDLSGKYFDSLNITDTGFVTFKTNSSYKHKIKLHAIAGTTFDFVQYEEGTAATPYEPYAVQVNAKPKLRPIPYSVTSNFVGEVSGDGRGNVAKGAYSTILENPSSGVLFEFTQSGHDFIRVLDGTLAISSRNISGQIAQHLFSFNVLNILEKRFGKSIWQGVTDVASKVAIAKGLLKKVSFNWYGYGNSPAGNRAIAEWWISGLSQWTQWGTNHTNNAVQKLSASIFATGDIPHTVDANGFFHLLVYTNASDGVTPSTINTDYVELVLDVALPELLPAKRGLAFNGVNQNFRVPSMMVDAIEIDCKLDVDNGGVLFQRYGVSSVYQFVNGSNSGNVTVSRSGALPLNERFKVRYSNFPVENTPTSFMSNIVDANFVKGTLYKVTCYLSGAVVAEYDFENPSNLVGDKVIPNAKNLIPSFEDSRWSLHANTQVLGKDVLRLNGTATGQSSVFNTSSSPNQSYYFDFSKIDGWYSIKSYSVTDVQLLIHISDSTVKKGSFTTPANTAYLKITHASPNTGTFDFIRPALYELSGKEGTIVGSPVRLNKTSKRSLYAKR